MIITLQIDDDCIPYTGTETMQAVLDSLPEHITWFHRAAEVVTVSGKFGILREER